MELSPKDIVNELDKYIVGQNEAKKAVAIALRNRYRRSKLSDELKEKISFPEFYDRFGQDVLYGEFDVSEVEQYIAEQGHTR